MHDDYLETAWRLRQAQQPFVLATVVWTEKPTSAKAGAKAIVTADGKLQGWVGGSCARPTVVREARKALRDGQPRLLRLTSSEERKEGVPLGIRELPLTCASGGRLEIFLEPHLPSPHLVVAGHLAVTVALVRLAKACGYRVTVMTPEPVDGLEGADALVDEIDFSSLELGVNSYVVVASHGNYDEDALAGALQSEAGYVALVSSRTRAATVMETLRKLDLSEEALQRIKYPAGLDIGATTPVEIALSILAEMIQFQKRSAESVDDVDGEAGEGIESATDPVCGMLVEVARANYRLDHEGRLYYFCSHHCRQSFAQAAESYLSD